MWRTNVIHPKDYYRKNGSNTCIEDVFKDINFLDAEPTASAGQKGTVHTKHHRLRMVSLSWLNGKDKTILSVIQPEKETSHLWGGDGVGAEGICGNINRLVRKRTGQAFLYHYLAYDLGKVKEAPF